MSGRSSTATSPRLTARWSNRSIAHRWPGYDVRFPGHSRTHRPALQHHRVRASRPAVRAALPADAIVRACAVRDHATAVTLDDGRTLAAEAVIDARGLRAAPPALALRLAEVRRPDARLAAATASTGRSSWTPRSTRSTAIASSIACRSRRRALRRGHLLFRHAPTSTARSSAGASTPMPLRRAGRSSARRARRNRRAAGRDRRRLRRLLARRPTARRARRACAPGCSTR